MDTSSSRRLLSQPPALAAQVLVGLLRWLGSVQRRWRTRAALERELLRASQALEQARLRHASPRAMRLRALRVAALALALAQTCESRVRGRGAG